MAGKRHLGTVDQTMYNKMSRVEAAPQHSIPCPGKTIPKDLQVCKNFLTYPLSSNEGQHSFNPWSSTTAYLQYAGNALNQHLQPGGVSKCQRPETERINNTLQLSDNSSNHFSAQHHPAHNYHMSPSRAYPHIAVPRPVYRSTNSFVDPAYQSRDFQSMGVHVGSQTLCPPAMEWSSATRFPYSSSPLYLSGIKNLHPTHNRYFEATGNMSSLPRSVQELGPVHRHRTDINTAVGTSPSCYQEDVFTDRLHSFAQHNMQVLCAEGSVSAGKPRHSAFTTPTHEHYKCIAYQSSPDSRMGHTYTNAYYDNAMDSYHQRSALHSRSLDKSVSPLNMKGSTTYVKAQKLHSGFVNSEPRAITQFDDGTQTSQAQAKLEFQISNPARTSKEPQMCPGQKGKTSMFGSGPINRDFSVNSANTDKEHVLGATHVNSDLHERALYEKCITEQSSHVSFLQQNGSSKISAFPTKSMVANEPVKESSLTSKVSSSPGSLHTLYDRRMSNATFDKQTVQNHNQAADTAHANSAMLNSSGSIYQHQISSDNQTSSREAEAVQRQGSALPQVSKMDADGPKSPPMPVINDVFSLAPYRAYLEGKAPHPFPVHQESEVENNISTSSFFSQPSSSSEKAAEVEKDTFKLETIPTASTECHDSENRKQQANVETGEPQDVHISNNTMDSEVLDLSLKRSIQTRPSTQDQVNVSHSSNKPCTLVTEVNLSQISEDLSIRSQESVLSQVSRIIPHSEKELHVSHTTAITSTPRTENSPSQATGKTSRFAQESCTNAKTYGKSQAPETMAQELQGSLNPGSGASEATQSLSHENLAKHRLQANKRLLYPLHKNYSYQAIKSHPPYSNEKCKSRVTKNVSWKLEENCTSQALKNFTPQARYNCPLQPADGKSDQHLESYKSYASKYPSLQAAETQPLSLQETYSSQTPETPQLQQNCSSRTTENCSSRATENCSSRTTENCSSRTTENCSSRTTENCSSRSPENCSSRSPENCSSRSTENCSLRSTENCSSRTTETFPQHSYYNYVSKPPETYSVNSSTHSANLSIFVNTFQTPTTFFPQTIIYSSPAAVFCPKNLNLPSYQHQNYSTEPTERGARKPNSCRSETSLSGSENEGPGFHSSKAFMMRKYKMMKLSNSGPEVQEASSNSASHALPRRFLLPSDAAQSLPPSAPESSPTLGEANVSLASADELAPNGSGQQFSELHRLVRAAITNSVARSPSNLLEDWLEKTKDSEKSKTAAKAKSGSRPNDPSPDLPCHDIWQEFDGVRLRLYKLLSQLETFMFTRTCPFPHVIRAGAIFIPIYLVKEVLFPELGSSIDRVLQRHKVELRPTTLSEEKLLRETELKECPSRMLKLLALKQLPDVYPDLLHLFCEHTIQNHLGSRTQSGLHTHNCSTRDFEKSECHAPKPSKEPHTASPRKGKASLIIRLQQVCKSPGSHVYKALQPKPLEKRGAEKLQTRKVCRKKSYRDRTLITYKRRRRVWATYSKSKGFPDLVGKRIQHLFDDGERETWFPGRVLRVHRRSRKLRDTQFEVWYDAEPGTRYFLELLQDYEKGWLKLDS